MRKLPPLAQLRAFEAAARLLSFQEAAKELGVTPTAISHQMKLLESHCGCPLFQRRPRPLSLTSAGASLLPPIRDGLDSFSEALARVRDDPPERVLRISTTNAFASRWLLPRLPQWRDLHPAFSFEVNGTDRTLDLNADECDIAIRWTNTAPANLASRELFRSSFCPVCSPKILTEEAPLDRIEDLRHHTIIHWYWSRWEENAPTWRWWFSEARKRGDVAPHIDELDQLTFQEELHAIDAVIAGQGIAICDLSLITPDLAAGRLVKVLGPPVEGAPYFLMHRHNDPQEPVIEHFYEWVKGQVSSTTSGPARRERSSAG